MKYEIVEIKEKTVAGLSERMRNDKNTSKKIGKMWNEFCGENGREIKNIKDRVNKNTMAVYFDYNTKNSFEYRNLVGCEVKKESKNISKKLTKIFIPSGKYAKFSLFGNPQTEVTNFWINFWKNFGEQGEKLERTYTYDFEEYIAGGDPKNMEINIYIAVK